MGEAREKEDKYISENLKGHKRINEDRERETNDDKAWKTLREEHSLRVFENSVEENTRTEET
jgi:hypothetical protein